MSKQSQIKSPSQIETSPERKRWEPVGEDPDFRGNANPFKLPGGPSPLRRLLLYAGCWAPAQVLLFFATPQFMPIFDKLKKADALSQPTTSMVAFVRLNHDSFFLPMLGCTLAFFLLDAGVVALLRRSRRADFMIAAWLYLVCGLAIAAAALMIYGFMAPGVKFTNYVP
jgi:hypothetical protein